MDVVKPKVIFNQDSTERYQDAKMIGGNPNGIINFNQTPHKAAYGLYKTAISRLWFPSQVDTSKDKQNYSKLTASEKRAFDLVLAQLITNDSIQTNQLMDGINRYITCPVTNVMLAVQSFQECFIEGTEILTDKGWKDFRHLTMDDMVANYQEDESITFAKPTQLYKKMCDERVYLFEGEGYYQHVTANHRIVYLNDMRTRHIKKATQEEYLSIETADNFDPKGKYLPVAGTYDIPVGNKELCPLERLAVAYAFYGLVNNSKHEYRIYRFHTKDKEQERFLEQLLDNAKVNYEKKVVRTVGYAEYLVQISMDLDFDFNWIRPLKKTYAWRQAFLRELSYYGTVDPDRPYQIAFYVSRKRMLDNIQFLAAITNTATKVKYYNPTWFHLEIVPDLIFRAGTDINKHSVPYRGNVYCCTVNTGKIICRLRNSVFVSGNCVHSESYSVMAEDIAQDTERIFNMHKVDAELHRKNQAVEDMYRQLYDKGEHNGDPSKNEILMVFVANQILEALIFPGGFSVGFSLEHKLKGCAEMFAEINLDELSHVELFKYIFRTTIKESFNNTVPTEVIDKAHALIQNMTDVEIRWLQYVTKDLLGYTKHSIELFVKNRANEICKNLMLPNLYEEVTGANPIEDLLKRHNKAGDLQTRTNFFESNATEYQKNSIIQDY